MKNYIVMAVESKEDRKTKHKTTQSDLIIRNKNIKCIDRMVHQNTQEILHLSLELFQN